MNHRDFLGAMSASEMPIPEGLVSTRDTRPDKGLVGISIVQPAFTPAPQFHDPQWGTTIEGQVALTIGGVTCRCGPGDCHDIAPGVGLAVRIPGGTLVIDVFANADRHSQKAR